MKGCAREAVRKYFFNPNLVFKLNKSGDRFKAKAMAKKIGYVVSLQKKFTSKIKIIGITKSKIKYCYLSLDIKETYRWTRRWLGVVVSLCFGAF